MPADYDLEVDELRAIAARDQTAFTRWFARCEIPLKRSLHSFAELVDVESIAQDTAFKVWQDASRITPDGRPGFLLRWSKTVALNDARNKVRSSGHRRDHRVPLPNEDAPEAGTTSPIDPFFRERIARCFERLQANQQRTFRARLDDGGVRADRDLATSIGMSFDAFRQNLARGRKALVACLGSFNIDVMEYLR